MSETIFSARQQFPAGLVQPRAGYRFSADALLLVDFAATLGLARDAAVADLGAGCGVVGLGLGLRYPELRLVGVENNQSMASCARQNARLLGLEQYRLIQGDVKDDAALAEARLAAVPAGQDDQGGRAGQSPPLFDAVLCNPPWRLAGSGRVPPSPDRRDALFGDAASLPAFFRAADKLLCQQGALALVCGANRLTDALNALPHGLRPVRLRFAHGSPGRDAAFFLLEARKGSRASLRVEAPLIPEKN